MNSYRNNKSSNAKLHIRQKRERRERETKSRKGGGYESIKSTNVIQVMKSQVENHITNGHANQRLMVKNHKWRIILNLENQVTRLEKDLSKVLKKSREVTQVVSCSHNSSNCENRVSLEREANILKEIFSKFDVEGKNLKTLNHKKKKKILKTNILSRYIIINQWNKTCQMLLVSIVTKRDIHYQNVL